MRLETRLIGVEGQWRSLTARSYIVSRLIRHSGLMFEGLSLFSFSFCCQRRPRNSRQERTFFRLSSYDPYEHGSISRPVVFMLMIYLLNSQSALL